MSSELLNLDERFGTCIDSTRVYVHDCERLHAPLLIVGERLNALALANRKLPHSL